MSDNLAPKIADLCNLLTQVSSEELNIEEIDHNTRYSEDLAIDSITLVAFMFLCEEHFGIDVANNAEKIAELNTIGETIKFIQLQRANG